MKAKINSTLIWGNPEALLEEYPRLIEFNYRIETRNFPIEQRIKDENGKSMIQEIGSRTERYGCIDIFTFEQLVDLAKAVNIEIIISADGNGPSIEIYDGYRE